MRITITTTMRMLMKRRDINVIFKIFRLRRINKIRNRR